MSDAEEDGRAAVVLIEAAETCREPNLDGEAVVDWTPARGGVEGAALAARGGVEGPALAFVRAAVLAVLAARRETEAVEVCFDTAGRDFHQSCSAEKLDDLQPLALR